MLDRIKGFANTIFGKLKSGKIKHNDPEKHQENDDIEYQNYQKEQIKRHENYTKIGGDIYRDDDSAIEMTDDYFEKQNTESNKSEKPWSQISFNPQNPKIHKK